jgi:hypothetical protein
MLIASSDLGSKAKSVSIDNMSEVLCAVQEPLKNTRS